MPQLSVLMSVYNAGPHLTAAVESVLAQTFMDFELLIADDASTDGSAAVLASLTDPRVRVFSFESNEGLAVRLNFLASQAKGGYLARMDADDLCHVTRFEKQVSFLDAHPDVSVCGTWIRVLGTDVVMRTPVSHNEIAARLLFTPAFAHPTVMMRRKDFEAWGGYPLLKRKQDFALWQQAKKHGAVFANLPEPLLDYRRPLERNAPETHTDLIRLIYADVLADYLGRPVSEREVAAHFWLSRREVFHPLTVTAWAGRLLFAAKSRSEVREVFRQVGGHFAAGIHHIFNK